MTQDPIETVRAFRAHAGDDENVIATAMVAGAGRHRAWVGRRAVGLAVAIAATMIVALWARGQDEVIAFELATGDTLIAMPSAAFRVASDVRDHRRIELERGAMLFDVRSLGHGERFEVVTVDARVSVIGTVFAVEAGVDGTAVRVFEGHVRVTDARGVHELGAGEAIGLGERIAALQERGLEAARRRGAMRLAAPVIDVAAPPGEAIPVSRVANEMSPTVALAQRAPLRAPSSTVTAPVMPPPEPALASVASSDPEVLSVAPELARAWIASGRAEDALTLAQHREGGVWRFVEADALRALRRWHDAASRYDEAARSLDGDSRVQAGYLAARIHQGELQDARAALASLDASGADARNSPLRERSLALRALALEAIGDRDTLALVAADYLVSFPEGSRAAWMRARAERDE